MSNSPLIENCEHQYAGIFLVTNSGKFIGQRRDVKQGIDNPGKIGTFGGTIEADEEPIHAVWRELTQEETNLKVKLGDIQLLFSDVAWRELTQEWEGRHFFVANIRDDELAKMEVYEGQGWAYIDGTDDPDLIDSWRPVVAKAIESLKAQAS